MSQFRQSATATPALFRSVASGPVRRRGGRRRRERAKARSDDEIAFEPTGAGTRITYIADFHLKGIFRPAAPFLAPVISRMGDDALAGLKAVLDRPR